jgi:hypothetical protein
MFNDAADAVHAKCEMKWVSSSGITGGPRVLCRAFTTEQCPQQHIPYLAEFIMRANFGTHLVRNGLESTHDDASVVNSSPNVCTGTL